MNQIEQMRSDSLTLFLSLACNLEHTEKTKATKIRKCAKLICSRTSDKPFKQALKAIRNDKRDGIVIASLEKAIHNYFRGLTNDGT